MSILHKIEVNGVEFQKDDIVEIEYAKEFIRIGGVKAIPLAEEIYTGRVNDITNDKILLDCSKEYQSDIKELFLENDGEAIVGIKKLR